MSASAKKKLRKEQAAAQLTEKQLNEKKEIKKLKTYTTIFVVAIAIVLVASLCIAGFNFAKNSGFKEKHTIAATIGDEKLNTVELSYYFFDTIDANYRNWSSSFGDSMQLYLNMMGLDLTLPLSEQPYGEDGTWADYFVDIALSTAKKDYLLADMAKAEGYTLSEDAAAMLEQTFDNLPGFASLYGYANVDSYLHAIYGPGASEKSYRAYAERSALANDYYSNYSDSIVIDDAAIRAYEADKYGEFSSYDYASYTISYSYFLTGGTEDEDGTITYSEEEKEAARAAAKAAAEAMPQCSSEEELNAAIAEMSLNENAMKECAVYDDVAFASLNSNASEWFSDSNRKEGDFTVIANESVTTDENGVETRTINGYTAYVYMGTNDNNVPLANVRHILVNFEHAEGEHTHDEEGNEVYSEEEKAAALEKAENLLSLYEMGDQTEEAFAELATANTDDTGSAATGGLYEDIAPVQGVYVESFTNWATDPAREAGDTGIIESTYGYHVMYYVGDDEMTYRDSMIRDEIHTATMTDWYSAIMDSTEATAQNTSLLNKDVVLAQQ